MVIIEDRGIKEAVKDCFEVKLYDAVFLHHSRRLFTPEQIRNYLVEEGLKSKSIYAIKKQFLIWVERGWLRKMGNYFIVC